MGTLSYWSCSNLCTDKNSILKFMLTNLTTSSDIREGYVYIITRKYWWSQIAKHKNALKVALGIKFSPIGYYQFLWTSMLNWADPCRNKMFIETQYLITLYQNVHWGPKIYISLKLCFSPYPQKLMPTNINDIIMKYFVWQRPSNREGTGYH